MMLRGGWRDYEGGRPEPRLPAVPVVMTVVATIAAAIVIACAAVALMRVLS